jgi:uncharacterized protein YfaS (alpha-2-macroglobulin family)
MEKAAPAKETPEASSEEVEQSEFTNDFMQGIKSNSRQYSHPLRKDFDKFGPRTDFTQTLLFSSGQQLISGLHTSSFFLNDQISSFQISVSMFSADGKYAFSKSLLISSKNIYSKLTIPNTMVLGDFYSIPITIVNNLSQQKEIKVQVDEKFGEKETTQELATVMVQGGKEQVVSYKLDTRQFEMVEGPMKLVVTLYVDGEAIDMVTSYASIILDGFKMNSIKGGQLTNKNIVNWNVEIPKTMVGEPTFTVKVYSKTITSILDSIENIIRRPCGCFEQASATTYPMIIALELLQEIKKALVDAALIKKVEGWIESLNEQISEGYNLL